MCPLNVTRSRLEVLQSYKKIIVRYQISDVRVTLRIQWIKNFGIKLFYANELFQNGAVIQKFNNDHWNN